MGTFHWTAMGVNMGITLVIIVLVLDQTKTANGDMEGERDIANTVAGLSPNAVPMMGKKADVPSFTSGFLPTSFPLYMRTQQSKRGPKPYPTTWHLGKRQPRTLQKTSWLGSLYKPAPSEAPLGKRSAIPNE